MFSVAAGWEVLADALLTAGCAAIVGLVEFSLVRFAMDAIGKALTGIWFV